MQVTSQESAFRGILQTVDVDFVFRGAARKGLIRAVLSMSVAGSALACASPTLPLPPPEAPTVLPGVDIDHVRLVSASCGGVEPYALVVVINQNANVAPGVAVGGSLADNCGRWNATVYAHTGDPLAITQESGDIRSIPLEVVVRLP